MHHCRQLRQVFINAGRTMDICWVSLIGKAVGLFLARRKVQILSPSSKIKNDGFEPAFRRCREQVSSGSGNGHAQEPIAIAAPDSRGSRVRTGQTYAAANTSFVFRARSALSSTAEIKHAAGHVYDVSEGDFLRSILRLQKPRYGLPGLSFF
jgi:hypothetical protein